MLGAVACSCNPATMEAETRGSSRGRGSSALSHGPLPGPEDWIDPVDIVGGDLGLVGPSVSVVFVVHRGLLWEMYNLRWSAVVYRGL